LRIRWTRRAARDLEAIEAYIETDDPQAAARVVLRILDRVEQLGARPHLGRQGRVEGTRELVIVGLPYIVPYRVRGNVLEVLRVLHAAMRWPEHL
jgi:addiction module RelE/StbE family toxin